MTQSPSDDLLAESSPAGVTCDPMDLPSFLLIALRVSERWKRGASFRCRISRIESLLYIAWQETSARDYLPKIEFALGARGPVPVALAGAVRELTRAGYLQRVDPPAIMAPDIEAPHRSRGTLFDQVLVLTALGEMRADELKACWPAQAEEIEHMEGRFAHHGHVELDEYIYMKYLRVETEPSDDLD